MSFGLIRGRCADRMRSRDHLSDQTYTIARCHALSYERHFLVRRRKSALGRHRGRYHNPELSSSSVRHPVSWSCHIRETRHTRFQRLPEPWHRNRKQPSLSPFSYESPCLIGLGTLESINSVKHVKRPVNR